MPSVRQILHQDHDKDGSIAEFLSLGALQYPVGDAEHSSSSSDHEGHAQPREQLGASFGKFEEDEHTTMPDSHSHPLLGDVLSSTVTGGLSRRRLKRSPFDRLLRASAPLDSVPGITGSFGYVDSPRLGMIYKPHDGVTYDVPKTAGEWKAWLEREIESNRITVDARREGQRTDNHVALLVTSATDIELLARDPLRVKCLDPCGLNFQGRNIYDYSKRLSMLAWVPELALVAVGSQAGRVMLVSLVKSSSKLSPNLYSEKAKAGGGKADTKSTSHLCFCIEKVLPSNEEEKRSLRPDCPLFGIAIGPLQEVIRDDDLKLKDEQRRSSENAYRLVLHYRDHTILSYQVRRPSGRDLEVF